MRNPNLPFVVFARLVLCICWEVVSFQACFAGIGLSFGVVLVFQVWWDILRPWGCFGVFGFSCLGVRGVVGSLGWLADPWRRDGKPASEHLQTTIPNYHVEGSSLLPFYCWPWIIWKTIFLRRISKQVHFLTGEPPLTAYFAGKPNHWHYLGLALWNQYRSFP